MNDSESKDYSVANGPQGLREILEEWYQTAQRDPIFSVANHYILYQLGNQKSLIKVDFAKHPCRFIYNDLLGRPATKLVKETIAEFLLEKYGDVVSQSEED